MTKTVPTKTLAPSKHWEWYKTSGSYPSHAQHVYIGKDVTYVGLHEATEEDLSIHPLLYVGTFSTYEMLRRWERD